MFWDIFWLCNAFSLPALAVLHVACTQDDASLDVLLLADTVCVQQFLQVVSLSS